MDTVGLIFLGALLVVLIAGEFLRLRLSPGRARWLLRPMRLLWVPLLVGFLGVVVERGIVLISGGG